MEYTDFYQPVWEDQWVANGAGGTIVFDHSVFRDNNKPNRTDTVHRDVANPWTGPGGWNLTVSNSLFFNTPGRAGVSGPQGDQLLIQNGYGTSSPCPLGRIELFNNVAFNTARFFVFGSQSDGAASVTAYNNRFLNVTGTVQRGPTSAPMDLTQNFSGSASDFLNPNDPFGADGLPFTDDDGFNLIAASGAVNPPSNAGTRVDIRGRAAVGNRDLGAYAHVP